MTLEVVEIVHRHHRVSDECIHGTEGPWCIPCEEGANVFVEDPTFRLNVAYDGMFVPTNLTWRLSSLIRWRPYDSVRRVADRFNDPDAVWEVEQISDGYWMKG